jgi:type I restriction enzyme S subunit
MLSDKTLRLDTKPQKAVKEYLEVVLRERQARAFIEENATGTSDSMKNISQKLICNIPVLLPPVETQKRIARDIQDREPNIEKIQQSIQDQLTTINALPAALLRQAFNGEL